MTNIYRRGGLLRRLAGHLGIESKGRAAVQRILAIAPGHTVSALRDTLKFSAPAKLEVYFDSLRRAGLPE
ncbi:MAG: hypothetical protein JWO24_2866 [Rhodospirillales bacterium]|nr:hypothetical protein [Rhodospirillales bacterium]